MDKFLEIIGESAAEAEIGLRLLVNLQQHEIVSSNEQQMKWAVDNGFEYIEIFEDSLLDSE